MLDATVGEQDQRRDRRRYIGTGGIDGYEGIQLVFDQGVNGGFQNGEQIGFSIDNDPNSIAGARKAPLDAGSSPELGCRRSLGRRADRQHIHGRVSDGTSATGKLQGLGNQGGAAGIASQALPNLDVTLTVNGLAEGGAGSYGDDGPTVLIQGPARRRAWC